MAEQAQEMVVDATPKKTAFMNKLGNGMIKHVECEIGGSGRLWRCGRSSFHLICLAIGLGVLAVWLAARSGENLGMKRWHCGIDS